MSETWYRDMYHNDKIHCIELSKIKQGRDSNPGDVVV